VLLEIAAALSILAYFLDTSQQANLWLGVVLFVVIILVCTISFFEEGASSKVKCRGNLSLYA